MLERKLHFEAELDELRLLLMREPRGHGAMSGAILQPPARADADWGVLFIEVSGLLPMCGHGTIGVATVLVETGMVAVTEPETVIRLDVPAGPGRGARAGRERPRAVGDDPQRPLVPAHAATGSSTSRATGEITYDMAFGGNFYAITPAADAGLVVDPARNAELVEAGLAVMAAINAADRPVHPADPRISGCHHVVFHEPGRDGADAVAATSIHPGWLDRSPCGTGHERPDGAAARARRARARARRSSTSP